ncbi:MAG: antibiotic biosynthesis monooxygenase [Alphaproteobacteria bacterium]|nr:antibiotic biosynthesis monooxygenase [Alphaproteobacteria bacterium]
MMGRVWRGWTAAEHADAYESLLRGTIFPGILGRKIAGFHRIDLFRRADGDEVEFLTLMWFEDLAAVAAFAGPDAEAAVVPAAARALLARFDARASHFELRETRSA